MTPDPLDGQHPGIAGPQPPATGAVVVPIRAFSEGKTRLAPDLSRGARERLLRWMADRVVDAAEPLSVFVVTSASEVRSWATARGFAVVGDPGTLDRAAHAGVATARIDGAQRALVCHADIPLARDLWRLASPASDDVVLAVRSRFGGGTPVLSIPTERPFRFRYGPDSFERHRHEAERAGLGFQEVFDPLLAHDVDTAADLADLPDHVRTLALSMVTGDDGQPLARRTSPRR